MPREHEATDHHSCEARSGGVSPCLSRRRFMVATGAGAVTVALGQLFPGRVFSQDLERTARFTAYPRRRIARLSGLVEDQPVEFLYPDDGPHSISMLVKLGRRAGGGIGLEQDIVAFNALCTHQGGLLRGVYQPTYKVAGPCPIHLTTFDLTRHGMVVAGHATDNLPQVVLETEGDDIYAVGVLGLIYGYAASFAYSQET